VPKPVPLIQAKSLIRALHGEVHASPAFWFMRQAGRYLPEYRQVRAKAKDFISLCLDPALASEITLQPVRRFAMDAAILFADILLVPYALGQPVAFKEGEGPVLTPITASADVDALAGAAGGALARLRPVAETVKAVAGSLPLDTALIGFAGAPWTVATYMVEGGSSRDFAAVRRFANAEPETFARLIDVLVEVTSDYLDMQIAAGAEAVQLFESWAGVLTDAEFHRWCVLPVREIVRRLEVEHPAVPVIGFPKGAGVHYREYAALTGVEALGLDSTVPLDWASSVLQPEVTLQGNLDPLFLVMGGAVMEQATRRILQVLGPGPFVFNLGHGIRPETPIAHVERLCEIIRHWRG
jgi:uroporphyrinogen decarboxylase